MIYILRFAKISVCCCERDTFTESEAKRVSETHSTSARLQIFQIEEVTNYPERDVHLSSCSIFFYLSDTHAEGRLV